MELNAVVDRDIRSEYDAVKRKPSLNAAAVKPPSDAYLSCVPSIKIAPGKRIKWRAAIAEEDTIRQNLSFAFMDAVPAAAAASTKAKTSARGRTAAAVPTAVATALFRNRRT